MWSGSNIDTGGQTCTRLRRNDGHRLNSHYCTNLYSVICEQVYRHVNCSRLNLKRERRLPKSVSHFRCFNFLLVYVEGSVVMYMATLNNVYSLILYKKTFLWSFILFMMCVDGFIWHTFRCLCLNSSIIYCYM